MYVFYIYCEQSIHLIPIHTTVYVDIFKWGVYLPLMVNAEFVARWIKTGDAKLAAMVYDEEFIKPLGYALERYVGAKVDRSKKIHPLPFEFDSGKDYNEDGHRGDRIQAGR